MIDMTTALLQQPLVIALGWTLLHFLWQGAALAAIYAVLMLMLRAATPEARYRAALACLVMLALTPVATFVYFASTAGPTLASAGLPDSLLAALPMQNAASWKLAVDHGLRPYLPWLVLAWFGGVCVASARMLSGWRRVRQLRSCIDFLPGDPWQHALATLKRRLRIRVPVQLASSTLIRIPMVIGWLKPLILIPPCVLAGLDSRQIEMILAHELAHIRRHDYLVNLLQAVVETLLFYHPAVRWISHQMRLEREKCCDRLVVDLSGDAVGYARALTNLEAIRGAELGLGLGASGGALYDRVQTLVAPRNHAASGSLAALLIASAALIGAANVLRTPSHPPATMPAPIGRFTMPSQPAQVVHVPAEASPAAGQLKTHQPETRAVSPDLDVGPVPAALSPPTSAQPVVKESKGKPEAGPAHQFAAPIVADRAGQTARRRNLEASISKPTAASQVRHTSTMQQHVDEAGTKAAPPSPQAAAEIQKPMSNVPTEIPMPHYPSRPLMNGHGATVVVSAQIGSSGAVDRVSIVGGPLDPFATAALAAVRQWHFTGGATRTLQFRFVFSTNHGPSNCPTVTGTHICGTTLDAGDEIKGSIRVYAASPQIQH